MADEELDLTGNTTPIKHTAATKAETAEADVQPDNIIDSKVPDLRDLVTPGQTNQDLVEALLAADDGRLIPWEECTLPSNGLYYNWPDGIVQVRAMGQTAEKVLATQRLAQSGQAIDYLFRECVRFPNSFDPTELLLGDRVFLLFYLRGITHGNMYEFAITCPNKQCEAVTTHQYDLNDLSRTVVWADRRLGQEPFKVILPFLSKAIGKEFWVSVRFLRAADANDMLARKNARRKMLAKPGGVRTRQRTALSEMRGAANSRTPTDQNQVLDETINQNLEKIIVNIMGVGDIFSVRSLIDKLHGQDTAAIREWLREHTPGIDNTVAVTCPECGGDFTIELPITESFFRPAKPGGV